MDWTVTITAAGDAPPVDTDQLVTFADALEAHAGIALGTPEVATRAEWGATVTVDAPSPAAAVARATEILTEAAQAAGLPDLEVQRVEALTAAELDRELAAPVGGVDLVGVSEIARMLDVSRQRVSTLQTRHDFPTPLAKLAAGPVWRRHDVEHWATTWERASGRPKKPKPHEEVTH